MKLPAPGLLRLLAGAVIGLFASGCASTGYMAARGRDAADIFTVSASDGVGARARVGPLHVGLIASTGSGGLRGGRLLSGVDQDAGELEFLCLPIDKTMEMQPGICFSAELFEPDDDRGKGFRAFSHLPFITTVYYPEEGRPVCRFHPYLTQIEVQVGLFFMPRIGFNPGELLDFILGWMGVDIFNDDTKQGALPSGQPPGPPLFQPPARRQAP